MNQSMKHVLVCAVLAATSAAWGQSSGDAAAGRSKAAMCIGCHGIVGYRASFPEVYQVPMISGQGARYLSAALQAYRKGDRRHPTMRSIAGSLSDQDIEDLATFYAAQLPAAPPPAAAAAPDAQVADLLKRGNCAACHGEGLNKPIDASYPKLAGQHGDYLYAALRAYRVENHPQVGRANAIMAAQAKPYTPAELKALSTYIASLPGELQTVPNAKFR